MALHQKQSISHVFPERFPLFFITCSNHYKIKKLQFTLRTLSSKELLWLNSLHRCIFKEIHSSIHFAEVYKTSKNQSSRYLSDEVAAAALLHGGGAAVHLPLPGARGQTPVVEGLAAHFRELRGQSAGRLLRRRPPHLPLLVVAGVAAARDRQELRLLASCSRNAAAGSVLLLGQVQ